MGILESHLDRSFFDQNRAYQTGRGAHKILNDYQRLARKNNNVLYMDISKYFPSINHELLFQVLCRQIADRQLLRLLKHVIESGSPRPQGLGTPSFF